MNFDIPAYLRRPKQDTIPSPTTTVDPLKQLHDQLDDVDDAIGMLETRLIRMETRLVTLMGHLGMSVPPARGDRK